MLILFTQSVSLLQCRNKNLTIHEDINGNYKCCYKRICERGSIGNLSLCSQSHPFVFCEPCKNSHYQPINLWSHYRVRRCLRKKQCLGQGLVVADPGISILFISISIP